MLEPYTFLALGDSYTIGEAVDEQDRWPVQLIKKLREAGINMADPKIVAATGWTTNELKKGIIQAEITGTYSIVSLLIGVNNQYREYPLKQYRKEFGELSDEAIKFAGGRPGNVLVISIPDYGITPFSKTGGLDAEKIRNELHLYNTMAQETALSKNINFISITENSRAAGYDADLLASDGLHPSAKMYAQWVNMLYKKVYNVVLS